MPPNPVSSELLPVKGTIHLLDQPMRLFLVALDMVDKSGNLYLKLGPPFKI